MVKRYWRVSLAGLGVGFILGTILFGVIALSSPDWIGYFTLEEFVRSISSYGLIGSLVSVAACAGGWLAVALSDRQLKKQPDKRIGLARRGAALGIAVCGIVAGIVAVGPDFGSWIMLIIGLTIAFGLASAIAAGALVSYAERRYSASSLRSRP